MNETGQITAVRGQCRSAAELAAIVDPGRRLTEEQEAIVSAPLGASLVVAGAGSGKTETLSLRMLYLLDHGARLWGRDLAPDELLCLTFTRKAAAEIALRASARIATVFGHDQARPEVRVSTYNAYAGAMVAEHGLRVAVDPATAVVTDAALWQLADAVVSSRVEDLATDAAVSSITSALPRLAAQARDHRVSPAALREWAVDALARMERLPRRAGGAPGPFTEELSRSVGKVRTLAAMAGLVEEFDARKSRLGVLDFADQVATAVRLAALPAVQELERQRYAAVLLDEFQDTSPPQLDLFALTFGAEHPVMAVGDPHQAIYGFRGASADALAQFVRRFGGDAVARHSLSVSWRNEASVLAPANAVVASLPQAVAAQPLRSRGEALGLPEPIRQVPGVMASRHLTLEDEAAAVAGFIASRRAELSHGGTATVTAAVLCRRRAQFPAIVDALTAAGIGCEVVGLGGLLDVPEVADLLALLESAHDPSRGDALMRLLTGERVALGPADLAALQDRAAELGGREGERASIVDALAALPEASWASVAGRAFTAEGLRRLQGLAGVIDDIRRHTYLPLGELIGFAERAWNLDIEVEALRGRAVRGRAVDALIDATRTFALGSVGTTLGAFLAWLDAARAEEDGLDAPVREPDPALVQVLTVHAAKGLEWDVVAVPGLNDGQFPKVQPASASTPFPSDSGWLDSAGSLPHELRLDGNGLPHWAWHAATDHKELAASIADFKRACGLAKLDEERRLFYVALTRARSHVLLSGSWFTAGVTMRAVSPFVEELLEASAVAKAEWAEPPADGAPPQAAPLRAPWPGTPSARQETVRALAVRVRESLGDLAAAVAEGQEPPPLERLPLGGQVTAMLAERAQRHQARVAVELPAHLSTSALVAMRKDRAGFATQLRRPVPVEPTLAAYRGSAMHAWIESQYGHVPLWEDEDETEAEDLEALKSRFLASEWAARTPTHVEADVELPIGGITIRSRIDAVFGPGKGLDRVTVVDWKTGAQPRSQEERLAREVQLAVYRLAWAAREGLLVDAVDAAFFYLADGATVRPERLLDEQGLRALISGDDPVAEGSHSG